MVNEIVEIESIENVVTTVLKSVRKSPKSIAKFKNRAKDLNLDYYGIPSSCRTRWSYLYKSLFAFVHNKDLIIDIL